METKAPQTDPTHRLVPSRAESLLSAIRGHIHSYPYLAVAGGAYLGYLFAGGFRASRSRRVLRALGGMALFSPIMVRLVGATLASVQPRSV